MKKIVSHQTGEKTRKMNGVSQILALSLILTISGCASTSSCWKQWRSGNGGQDLAIEIAVPMHDGVRNLCHDCDTNLYFHVIVSNVSTNPVRLWEDWCSWGSDNVTFEIIMPNGAKTIVHKGAQIFGGNRPDYYVLLPGESSVRDIKLNESFGGTKVWENVPKLEVGQKIKMRAIFEIDKEEDSDRTDTEGHVTHELADDKQYHIWTGKAASEWKEYIISEGWTFPED
jgi:hypothetical protein